MENCDKEVYNPSKEIIEQLVWAIINLQKSENAKDIKKFKDLAKHFHDQLKEIS